MEQGSVNKTLRKMARKVCFLDLAIKGSIHKTRNFIDTNYC